MSSHVGGLCLFTSASFSEAQGILYMMRTYAFLCSVYTQSVREKKKIARDLLLRGKKKKRLLLMKRRDGKGSRPSPAMQATSCPTWEEGQVTFYICTRATASSSNALAQSHRRCERENDGQVIDYPYSVYICLANCGNKCTPSHRRWVLLGTLHRYDTVTRAR